MISPEVSATIRNSVNRSSTEVIGADFSDFPVGKVLRMKPVSVFEAYMLSPHSPAFHPIE